MQFYAYLWLREDGTPYYAGKGKGRRAYAPHRHIYPPVDTRRILIFNRDSEAKAFDTERELIWNWGRKDLGTGCLRNHTDGGEGTSGRQFSTASKQKIAAATARTQRGRKHTSEHTERVAAAHRGNKRTPESMLGAIQWHRTHHQTPEWKAKVEASKRGRIYSAEAIAHMCAAQQGHAPTFINRKHTPAAIAKQSAARRAYWERRRACL